jgi:hypothetical protein
MRPIMTKTAKTTRGTPKMARSVSGIYAIRNTLDLKVKASAETKAKLSAMRKGVPHSAAWSAKIGDAHRGKTKAGTGDNGFKYLMRAEGAGHE